MEYIKKEIFTGHASPIPESASDKIYNSIVRIENKRGKATGFFMKFRIKNKEFKFLFTNNHVLDKKNIDSKEEILIKYGKKDK